MEGLSTTIGSLINPDVFQKLKQIGDKEDSQQNNPQKNLIKLPDRIYSEALKNDEELNNKIIQTMKSLVDSGIAMPVLHFTSKGIKLDGEPEVSTGFVENIKLNGFRARDTNVAAFVKREQKTFIAEPQYFLENPYKILSDVSKIINRYSYHGTRTNKESLQSNRDKGIGVPVVLVIDASRANLQKGSDYDDHFILKNHISPDFIMGVINVNNNQDQINKTKSFTSELMTKIGEYVEDKKLHHVIG